jgi:uncharacterized membrane protein YphA (DoxX/SURF4 family)
MRNKSSQNAIESGYDSDGETAFQKTSRIGSFSPQQFAQCRRYPMSPIGLLGQCRGLAERIPYSVVALVSRIAVASVFWQSGQTKVAGFSIREETFALFSNICKIPLLSPDVAAYLSTIGEHVFSALLVVGLVSRLSAVGLLFMTAVIEFVHFPRWMAGTRPLDGLASPNHWQGTGCHLARPSGVAR